MSALNLLVLRAKNPAELVAFYSGMGLKFVRERHGKGPVHHSSNAGGAVFEIYPCENFADRTTGIRIGFQVPSIEQTILACSAHVIDQPKMTQWGRRAVIEDPEGHRIELVEAA